MADARQFWITRLLLERGLGVVCLIAFIVALNQFRPLLGAHGLLPVRLYIKRVPFYETPSLFYWFSSDAVFTACAWIGIVLSALVISGVASRYSTWLSFSVWAAIYILYLSFVNVGQDFYAFGWESILLEGCFYAMFLGSARVAPNQIPIWLFRWLLFRIMFGAGLIKLRGDPCWRDLTCLNYYYETQPMPNPLSWAFHWGPEWTHKAGVAFNHFVELIVPFGYFGPQPIRGIAGLLTIVFQLFIMMSGNLSWLNFLTLILAFSTLDAKFIPAAMRWVPASLPSIRTLDIACYSVGALIAVLSIQPVLNMISAGQVMNTNYNPLHLAGTYGAFGSITRPRYEVIVEGTSDRVILPNTRWLEYQFKGKPGDVNYRPPQIAPYHLRLDWLMWFAALGTYQDQPWFINFMAKLLENDRAVLSLLRSNPFPNQPPQYVRARLYEYHFATPEEHRRTGAWWTRTLTGAYFPVVSLNDPPFRELLRNQGWLDN
ncbi:MAG: lipase maturation factor family protein [Bryobacteraceae bacterium]